MRQYFVLVTLKNSYIDLPDAIFICLNVTLSIYLSCLSCLLLIACLCWSPPQQNQCCEQAIMFPVNIIGKEMEKIGVSENFNTQQVSSLKMRGVVSDTNLLSSDYFLLFVNSTSALKTFALNNAFQKGSFKKKRKSKQFKC